MSYLLYGHPEEHGADPPVLVLMRDDVFVFMNPARSSRAGIIPVIFDTVDEAAIAASRIVGRRRITEVSVTRDHQNKVTGYERAKGGIEVDPPPKARPRTEIS